MSLFDSENKHENWYRNIDWINKLIELLIKLIRQIIKLLLMN